MKRLILCGMLLVSMSAAAFDLDELKARIEAHNNKTSGQQPAPAAPQAAPAQPASGLAQFTAQQQADSLKQALKQGAETAVNSLAKKDGYLGNERVRIPLPDELQKADDALRRFGMGKYSDDLITSMNRAAEAAVPEAKTLLIDAVKKMTVNDAKEILLGSDDAATQYFRRNTEVPLSGKFKPIVGRAMEKVKVATVYDRYAGKGVKLGLIDERNANLEDFITRKALDGLFLMMAEQEKEIRAHPMQAAGNLAQQVFSSLLKP